MVDPRDWTTVVLIGVAVGVVMAAEGPPWWAFPLVLVVGLVGLRTYQRRT